MISIRRDLKEFLMSDWKVKVLSFLFIALTVWWLRLPDISADGSEERRFIWGASYQTLALWGGLCGIFISKLWGGYKSVMGRSILAFSIGLLFQVLGQSVYSYHNIFLHTETPYPSLGDVGFFGSIPFYIYGTILLGKACGVQHSLRAARKRKIAAIAIPLLMLGFSYFMFLRGYEFDWTNPLIVFLDFGYPLGQAIYVSFAISAFFLTKHLLGGMMRGPVLMLLFALVTQYTADYTFLYQAYRDLWYVGNWNDYLYAFSYLLMALSLLYIGYTLKKIKEK